MKDKFVSFIEYVIASFCLLGAVSLMATPALDGKGNFIEIFGSRPAIIVYALWFLFLGLGIAISKIRNSRKWERFLLFSLYATCVFIFLIEWVAVGWSMALADEVLLSLMAAYAYLSRTPKPEPMTAEEFLSEE